jgi:hypothetical protein
MGWMQNLIRDEPQRGCLIPITVLVIGGASVFLLLFGGSLFSLIRKPPEDTVREVKSELRNLAVNLETYLIDHNTYPPATDENGNYVALGESVAGISAGLVPRALTTPISYAAFLPMDPCYQPVAKEKRTFRYATNGKECWILASDGPDGDIDVRVADFPSPGSGECSWWSFMSHFGVGNAIEYDASNGTASSGDIVRVGP